MINDCFFVGRLTREPELKRTPTDKEVCSFSIAVDAGINKTAFPQMVAWENQAVFVSRLHKGTKVAVHCRYGERKYRNGNDDKITAKEFTIITVEAMDAPKKREEQEEQPHGFTQNPEGLEDFEEIGTDDELPF